MRATFREQALRDIEAIHSYIRKESLDAALNVVRAIYAGVQFIAEQPEASTLTNDSKLRVKVVRKYHYKIFYTIKNLDTFEVLHVRHTSRDLWKNK